MTLCNINQGRSSLFRQFGLESDDSRLLAVLKQAYFGIEDNDNLTSGELESVREIFSSSEVVQKGFLTDAMCGQTAFRDDVLDLNETAEREITLGWEVEAAADYVKDAGWYFKTLAVQELGNGNPESLFTVTLKGIDECAFCVLCARGLTQPSSSVLLFLLKWNS